MSFNAKNYTEQGGDITVITGALGILGDGRLYIGEDATLTVEEGATVEGLAPEMSAATLDTIGGVRQCEFFSSSSATTLEELVEDLNTLIDRLKTTGIVNLPK